MVEVEVWNYHKQSSCIFEVVSWTPGASGELLTGKDWILKEEVKIYPLTFNTLITWRILIVISVSIAKALEKMTIIAFLAWKEVINKKVAYVFQFPPQPVFGVCGQVWAHNCVLTPPKWGAEWPFARINPAFVRAQFVCARESCICAGLSTGHKYRNDCTQTESPDGPRPKKIPIWF